MRKSILGIFLAVVVLALLVGEKNYLSQEAEEGMYRAVNTEGLSDTKLSEHEIVKAAEFPGGGNVIVIEEEAVPLAAFVPEAGESVEAITVMPVNEVGKSANTADKKVAEVATDTEEQSKLEDLGGGVRGYYDDEAASALIVQVNAMRSGVKNASALSAELNDIAKRRALSCVKDFSHNGMETSGECMAIGQKDAAGVVTAWYVSDEHRSYMSDTSYTQVGAACIRYEKSNGQLENIWVLVLN